MHKEGLIPFKSSTNQAIASLYFLRISISFYFFSSVIPTDMITNLHIFAPKKAYFRCLGNSFRINPSKLISTSCTLSSLLLDFSALCSFRLSTVLSIQNWNSEIQLQDPQYT